MIDHSLHAERVAHIKDTIESIPPAMRQMGWTVSANLMERWITSPAWTLPSTWKGKEAPDPRGLSHSHLDQCIVRMNWAMSHQRVIRAMQALRSKMANAPAKKVLHQHLAQRPWVTGNRIEFGNRNDNAVQLDRTCQSNFIAFGDSWDTMDDLYGSLGMATLKVALIGEATRDARSGKLSLRVTNAGFYIRDTYDFNNFQYLGTWTKNGILNKAQTLADTALGGMVLRRLEQPIGSLYNGTFDTYRQLTGFGGDFVIYSDVYWERVDMLLDLP